MAYRAPDGARFKRLGEAVLYAIETDANTKEYFADLFPVTFAWFMRMDGWNLTRATRFDPLLKMVLREAQFTEERDHA